jgi:hypothetical protein
MTKKLENPKKRSHWLKKDDLVFWSSAKENQYLLFFDNF